MVDPQVLENCGIDSKEYTGFAFGMGIERQAMMQYGINDMSEERLMTLTRIVFNNR